MKKMLLSMIAVLVCIVVNAQELPELTPLSPNAAAISKYGEMPVGHFTGIPSISIPLTSMNSKKIGASISLGYHAGGNKVEDMASDVGLGWSIGGIPSLSRSVRNHPDEGALNTVGYFDNYLGGTIKQLYGGLITIPEFKKRMYENKVDTESDIYHFSLNQVSGKFFYQQQTGKFYTLDSSKKIKVSYDKVKSSFEIVDDKGVVYLFTIKETTAQSGASASQPVTSSWKISKMYSPSKKDSITFDYSLQVETFKTLTPITKYIFGSCNNSVGSISTTTQVQSQKISKITFSNGYVDFNYNTTEREDLQGGKSLSTVKMYTGSGILEKSFHLNYHYTVATNSGTPCANTDLRTRKRLMLTSVTEKGSTGGNGLTHSFEYNTDPAPCRLSAAQDYWGFYNGKNSNVNLVPSTYISTPTGVVQYNGADRTVDTSKSQFSILKKITYPTGGSSEFTYENNTINSTEITTSIVNNSVGLEPDFNNPNTTYYEKAFTMNLPADAFINNNNVNGGSYAKITITDPGCDLSQGANICAVFKIIGTSPATSSINYSFHKNTEGIYLPNGNYKITAQFNQTPANHQNFSYSVDWKERQISNTGNTSQPVGGLRIKKILNYDGASHANDVAKNYSYTINESSTTSSGDLFGDAFRNYIDNNTGVNNGFCYRIKSYPNASHVSQSGSFIGYKRVTESLGNNFENGKTVYTFTHAKDEQGTGFPYPPGDSFEFERGKPLSISVYKKEGDSFLKTQKTLFVYNSPITFFHELSSIKYGIYSIEPIDTDANYVAPVTIAQYEMKTGRTELAKKTMINYHQNDSITTVTNYFYENPAHVQVTRTELTTSQGDIIKSKTYYPDDVTNISSLGHANLTSLELAAINALKTQHRISEPIQVESYKNNVLTSVQRTNYKDLGNAVVLPEKVQTSKGLGALEDRVVFHSYYANGNVKEVSKKDGTHIVYLWGYQESQPIAKIENTTYSALETAIGTLHQDYNTIAKIQGISNADNDRTLNGLGNEGKLRTALEALRVALVNAQVTYFTYDPLVGVTSVTDPRGKRVYYEYDNFNRLEYVKDHNGKILSKNEYHYKN